MTTLTGAVIVSEDSKGEFIWIKKMNFIPNEVQVISTNSLKANKSELLLLVYIYSYYLFYPALQLRKSY